MSESAMPRPDEVHATAETFQQLAVEPSHQRLVLVDFWAAWCQPCRMLGPLLDQLAQRHAGKLCVVKVDIDSQPELAGHFGVQSIPAVYALRNGQVVDGFVGLLGEADLEAFAARWLPTPAEEQMAAAAALEATDPAAAEAAYRQAAELDARLDAARIGVARTLLAQGRVDDAQQVVDQLAARGYLEPEAERVRAELDLRRAGRDAGQLEPLRQAVAECPEDWPSRFKLAEGLAAAGNHAEALEHLLMLVQRDRHATGEQARRLMVDLFQVLPGDSDLVHEYRRKLSTALY